MRTAKFFFLTALFTACASSPLDTTGSPGPAKMDGGLRADDQSLSFVVHQQSLLIPEGNSAGFTVALLGDPHNGLSVSLTSSNPQSLPVSPGSFLFTSDNFSRPLHVTVNAPLDDNDVSESATITISAGGVTDARVAAAVLDSTHIDQVGWPAPFDSSSALPAGPVVCYQVHVGVAATLDSFGVYTPGSSGDYRMALYSDNGGAPGILLAQMPVGRPLADGVNQDGATPHLPLSVGDDWLCLRAGQTIAVGFSQMETGAQCIRDVDLTNLDDPWPATFGEATCGLARLCNFWIVTDHQ